MANDDHDKEDLLLDDIGLIESEEVAAERAVLLANQAQRILHSSEGWVQLAESDDDIKLETKPIKGSLAEHNTTTIPLVRSEGRVECSPAELYALLITKEGYILLDPNADPSEFDKPFLGPVEYEGTDAGRTKGKIQLEHSTLKVPMIATRDYVVANVHDSANLTFASSSVLHAKYPGGTRYQSERTVVNSWSMVRTAIAGAYSCQPVPGEDGACMVRVWQWVGLGGWIPDWLCHKSNVEWFRPFYARVRAHFDGKKSGEDAGPVG